MHTTHQTLRNNFTYFQLIWIQFKKNRVGLIALGALFLFLFVGLYAPFFASSKPLVAIYDGEIYFPLFRYLFYPGFFTKPIDLFFNLLMFTCPLALLTFFLLKDRLRNIFLGLLVLGHISLFIWILFGLVKDPASDQRLQKARAEERKKGKYSREDPLLGAISSQTSWGFDLSLMSPYEKLNRVLRYRQRKAQHEKFAPFRERYFAKTNKNMPTLFAVDERNELEKRERLENLLQSIQSEYQTAVDRMPELIAAYLPYSHGILMAKYDIDHLPAEEKLQAEIHMQSLLEESKAARIPLLNARNVIEKYRMASNELAYLDESRKWLEKESKKFTLLVFPFLRSLHWEDDAGGAQLINRYVPWNELTRVNRKDLMSSLLFGIRVSLVVGIASVALALSIGIPLGMFAGYFGGKVDLAVCRLLEVWEAMPTFFVLLLVVAITQTKSIFLVIAVLGLFGWTGIARFMRGEMLKQKDLAYVLSCKSLGYGHWRTMFSHILPNAIPPVLTLLPFCLMGAITSEAGLSFLGLGEEGSASWGVLMDEGRTVFPAESYLLWPPAVLLTGLLICIALVGDSVRDALDPKMRS